MPVSVMNEISVVSLDAYVELHPVLGNNATNMINISFHITPNFIDNGLKKS